MWSSPPHTNTSKILGWPKRSFRFFPNILRKNPNNLFGQSHTSTCGTTLTENQLETGRRSLIQPKLQERSAHNWVGDVGLLAIGEERDLCWQLPPHCTSQPNTQVRTGCWYAWWLGTEYRANQPWERTRSSCKGTAWRAWGMVQAESQSPLSAYTKQRQTMGGSGSSGCCWCSHRAASQNLSDSPWKGVPSGSFPGRGTPVPPTPYPAWSQTWGGRVLREHCHRDSPGPRRQHNYLDSYSHSTLSPEPPGTTSGSNTRKKGTWPQAASKHLHQQCIGSLWPNRASLASVLTSFGTEHTLKGNRALKNQTLKAFTLITGEQTPPPTRLWQPRSKEEVLPNIQCRLWTPQYQSYPLYQGDNIQHTLRKSMASTHTTNSLCTKNTGLT